MKLLWAALAFAGFAQAQVQPQPLTIEGAATHVYKKVGDVELRLHVFAPATLATAPRPAIVFFFGGGWRTGNVLQFVPQSKYLAERGMVAIVADYRVFDRHGTTPLDAIADGKSAMRWVRSHARELGVDPGRIAAGGGSSGGHLAASTAVLDGFDQAGEDLKTSSKPNALVLFNPAVDTSAGQIQERFLGKGRDASPVHHLRKGVPPTVIFHGKADQTVPYEQVERFCSESQKLGNQCQLFGYEGATHGFFNAGKWRDETVREMDRFLTSLGYIPAR